MGSAGDDGPVLVEDDEVRVGELQLAVELPDLAGEDPPGARLQGGLPVADQPCLTEEGQGEIAPPIRDGRLQPGLPGRAVVGVEHLGVDHLGQHRDLLAVLQHRQVTQLRAGEVAAWHVAHQIADGPDLQRLERLGRLGPDDVLQPVVQPAEGVGPPCRRGQPKGHSSPSSSG